MEYTELLEKQILGRLRVDNPWWTEGEIPEFYHQFTPRPYLDLFLPLVQATDLRRALILLGPRRVGKTVLMFHTIQHLIEEGVPAQHIIYLSVETPIYHGLLLEQLFNLACRLLGRNPAKEQMYVFYDEIQYLAGWEVNLKSLVDTYRTVKFVASGSAAAELGRRSDESGAGRFTDFHLPPLTFYEYLHLKGYESIMRPVPLGGDEKAGLVYSGMDMAKLNGLFIDYINYGGYPEVVFSGRIRENPGQFIRHDIIDKVLLRDLPGLYGIGDVQELNALFSVIAYRSGEQFSYEALSRETGIQKETLRKYIGYLEAAFLVKVLHRTDDNARRYQRETQFKLYLTNPSLRCALFQPIRDTDDKIGNMVETAVFAQWIPRQGACVHYANWRQGSRQPGEVDLVGLDPARQKPGWAVEIKWSDRYYDRPGELASLLYFMKKHDLKSAWVTGISRFGVKEAAGVRLQFLPAACYAYTVGRCNLERHPAAFGL